MMQVALLLGFLSGALAAPPRHWPQYSRSVTLLDSPSWKFGLHLDRFDSLDPNFKPTAAMTPNTTRVPSCFDAAGFGIHGARGVGMYATTFSIPRGRPSRLQFGACSFYCRVFVDGNQVGEHRAGGYSMFYVDVPSNPNADTRDLFVIADNRKNATTAPTHTGGDFWMYGGIMRSVAVHELPAGPTVWRAEVHTVNAAGGVVDLRLVLTQPLTGDFKFTVAFDGGASTAHTVRATNGVVLLPNVTVPNPKLWGLRKGNLHTVTINDAASGQGLTERFGLRKWDVEPNTYRLRLNGQVVKLHGWNHHTQAPVEGDIAKITAVTSDAQFDFDLAQMLEAGTTFVRGAHYPQDQRWLDRLDEAGVVMWEETLGPSTSTANMRDAYFIKYQLEQVEQMLDASFNHPSIMAWGFFNEGPSNDVNACVGYKACSDAIMARDKTRFVTWASNQGNNDKCMQYASLVSYNKYPAWYDRPMDLPYITTFWNSQFAYAEANFKKPFVVSETGAGGIYEWSHNATAAFWTTAYQTLVLDANVKVALSSPYVSGITLWHFFDFKVDDNCPPCDYEPGVLPPVCRHIDTSCGRPGGANHKGVVDAWRRKKESYAVVARLYNASLSQILEAV